METTKVSVTDKAKAYASSAAGIVHASALVSSFVAFVCNESVSSCRGFSYCPVLQYRSTYSYFSAVALSALLISGVFYVLHCTGMYGKLRCTPKRKLLVELSCISGIIFFYAFGNLFMISRTGHNTVYMVSTLFGFVAMSMLVAQLVLIFRQNSRLIAKEQETESFADVDVDSDDSASHDGEPSVQVTVIKSLKMGDHSPGNMSLKNSCSFDNLNLENNSVRNLSLNSSSSRRKNPSMVDNEDYCTSSSSEDDQVVLKNKLSLSD